MACSSAEAQLLIAFDKSGMCVVASSHDLSLPHEASSYHRWFGNLGARGHPHPSTGQVCLTGTLVTLGPAVGRKAGFAAN